MRQISDSQVTRLKSLVHALQGLVAALEKDAVALPPEAAERIAKFASEGRCLSCGELFVEGEERRRGCHQACYVRTTNHIKSGRITLKEAIDSGLMTPTAGVPGRKSKRPDPIRDMHAPAIQRAEDALKSQVAKRKRRDKRRDNKTGNST